MTDLDAYVAHAGSFGGFREVWETARGDLDAIDLGELAAVLRDLGSKKRNETFSMSRQETTTLIARLIEAGVTDAGVCRMAGVPKSKVRAARREPAATGLSVTDDRATVPPPASTEGARSLKTAPISPDGRVCAWCTTPLPESLKASARFCPGGRCKQAAYRAGGLQSVEAK